MSTINDTTEDRLINGCLMPILIMLIGALIVSAFIICKQNEYLNKYPVSLTDDVQMQDMVDYQRTEGKEIQVY